MEKEQLIVSNVDDIICPSCGSDAMEPNGGNDYICADCGYECEVIIQ